MISYYNFKEIVIGHLSRQIDQKSNNDQHQATAAPITNPNSLSLALEVEKP